MPPAIPQQQQAGTLRRLLGRLRQWARRLRDDVMALSLARGDPRVPWPAKLLALAVVAYALSPIDLIPDFIPVLGLLDELVILPLGIALAIRLIPPAVLSELRARARQHQRAGAAGLAGAVLVLTVWGAMAVLALASI